MYITTIIYCCNIHKLIYLDFFGIMDERIRTLIDKAGIDRLSKETEIGSTRWRTVRYDKRTRISTKELDELLKLYPDYALWVTRGVIAPEAGQTSPEYDEAHSNLDKQSAGSK